MDNVQKEGHVVSVMTNWYKETCTVVRDEEDDRLLLHQTRRPRLTKGEKNPQTQAKKEALETKGAKFRAVTKILKTRHVKFGILPYVKTTSLKNDACMEENVSSDTLRLRRSPAKSQRKVVRKDQLHYWRSLHNWVLHLKILIRENLFYVTKENWDQNTPSNSPRALGTKKMRKSHREEIIQKCELHERSPCAPKFGERSRAGETLHQERRARRTAWDFQRRENS